MNIKLKRPIIILDFETTGTSVVKDRICSIGFIKITPEGEREEKKMLINPTIPIPPEASEVHGITDEAVSDAPTFRQISKAFKESLSGCDLAGYNIDEFDLPILIEEFQRCAIIFPEHDLRTIDALKIERKVNSHKLEETFKRYLKTELEGAHDALADCLGTLDVLTMQKEVHDLPDTVEDIIEFIDSEKKRFDYAGKTYFKDGVVYWNFGQHRDKPVLDNRRYLNWVLSADFPSETKTKLRDLLNS